ncbi:hypothetical protein ACIBCH_09685 [Amycolatopsis thailandensis]|uniref:hypothetical protein n=1 Tax=Amycolatopsis thailandensis TaxID=589330 RepID=UPI00379E863C
MTELIEAANYHQTRRHYTTELVEMAHGASGRSLCDNEVFDQAYQDYTAKIFSAKQVANSSLPLCKRCERKAAKEGLEVPK